MLNLRQPDRSPGLSHHRPTQAPGLLIDDEAVC
jgi:hypothetical protein